MRQLVLATIAQLAIATGVFAQQVTLLEPPTSPANPTAGEPVGARVHIEACSDIPIAVARDGAVIDLRYQEDNCPIIPIPTDETVNLGTLPAGTYDLRVVEVSDAGNPRVDDEAIFVVAAAPCDGLCLLGSRFTVSAGWTTAAGQQGSAHAVPMTDATGAFWFFSADNVELVVKALDACSYNSRHWFFAAGLTDVGVVLHVTDNLTGAQRTYFNPVGRPFQPITDTQAFGCP